MSSLGLADSEEGGPAGPGAQISRRLWADDRVGGGKGVCARREERGAETRSLGRREAPGSAAAAPRGPARPWGILGAGRGGGGPFKRRARPQGPSGSRGPEARSARQRPARPEPAAAMAAPPPPDEQDFIQAYEEVREKYKGTAAAPAHPAGCLPAGPDKSSGRAVRPLTPRLRGRPHRSPAPWPSPSLTRPARPPAARSAEPGGHALNRAWCGAGGWGGPPWPVSCDRRPCTADTWVSLSCPLPLGWARPPEARVAASVWQ